MEVEYKKDLRHNYMVIIAKDNTNTETYSIKMLEHHTIEGILPVEQRRMDNKLFYYYEITGKQSIVNILDKMTLSYENARQLCYCILNIMDKAYEFLLPEDDFVLTPEYIYIDVTTNAPSLCFYPGYQKSIKEQMNTFLEYLMNKVDYNDKEAVLLVYQLYAVSREEGFTFDHLMEVLQNKPQPVIKEKVSQKKKSIRTELSDEPAIDSNQSKRIPPSKNTYPTKEGRPFCLKASAEEEDNIIPEAPVMMEKIEGETEISCYPLKNLIYSGICIFAGVVIIILSLITGILYNAFGNRIDYSKLFAMLLIILCIEGYILKKLLDKKSKVTKMVKTCEYIDPRKNFEHPLTVLNKKSKAITASPIKPQDISSDHVDYEDSDMNISQPMKPQKQNSVTGHSKQIKEITTDEENDYNPTCLLNSSVNQKATILLKPLDDINYKIIPIVSFPFYIGKLKKNVDYCLDKDVVSRYHAKITKEAEQYYLTDLNSTNGTFINSEPVMTYQKKEIKFGDEIAFADIKYLFTQ